MENQEIRSMLEEFRETDSHLLRRIASDLLKPSRNQREVNLSRINRYTKENEFVIVPGKVLGGGDLQHKVTIAAFKYSGSAVTKLKDAGATVLTLRDLSAAKLKGKRVRIIG